MFLSKFDLAGCFGVDFQTKKVRSGVVANDIQVLFRAPLLPKIQVSVEDHLLARVWGIDERLARGSVNHRESATWSLDEAPFINFVFYDVLLREYLRADRGEASTLHRHCLSQAATHCARYVILHFLAFLENWWPASDMDIDVLRVFIVPQQGLCMLPAVQASDIAERALHHSLEGLGLAFTPNTALDMCWLDLSAMMHNITIFVNE